MMIVAFVALMTPPPFLSKDQDVVVSFRMAQSKITLHEPVLALFSIRNNLSDTIEFDLGSNRIGNLQFGIVPPDGIRIAAPRIEVSGVSRLGRLSLGPGKVYEQNLLIDQWHKFDQAGDYRVELRFIGPVRNLTTGEVINVSPQILSFKILPRDPERLKSVCMKLAQTATDASYSLEGAEAALSLGYVLDPISIPYLQMVLRKGGPLSGTAAAGLARIGTSEAVDALISALTDSDMELASIVRSALSSVMTEDKDVKDRIAKALQRGTAGGRK